MRAKLIISSDILQFHVALDKFRAAGERSDATNYRKVKMPRYAKTNTLYKVVSFYYTKTLDFRYFPGTLSIDPPTRRPKEM